MAHLEVEPKPARPWWVWALIIIILVVLAASIYNRSTSDSTGSPVDTTSSDSSKVN